MLSRTTKKQKKTCGQNRAFHHFQVRFRTTHEKSTRDFALQIAFIVRHIRFIETYRLELYIELSIQSLLEFTGVTQWALFGVRTWVTTTEANDGENEWEL